jgi:bifunctional DNA-binding transcriptional regulator/antitoxin component of YhaV-PrlF toxin-antitoxin module
MGTAMLTEMKEKGFRPKSGKTARVWDIADEITRQTGQVAPRKDVMQRFQAEGGNANTASTQYSQWKAEFINSGAADDLKPRPGNLEPVQMTIAPDGRLLIPAEFRKAMMLNKAGAVTARVVDGELRLLTPQCAIKRLQDLVAEVDQGQGSVVEELLRERRAEAKRETDQ